MLRYVDCVKIVAIVWQGRNEPYDPNNTESQQRKSSLVQATVLKTVLALTHPLSVLTTKFSASIVRLNTRTKATKNVIFLNAK